MLIDVHAHFYQPGGQRADWNERNTSRLRAGAQIGITCHVASILGSWGRFSPTYFPSRTDMIAGNDALLTMIGESGGLVAGYACVNPNYTAPAIAEIDRCLAAGMIGVKLAASRRADDPLLDPIAECAYRHQVPILHHIWQHRRHEWPGQEASDGAELADLARRHRDVSFILAHIGGGGDWQHTLHAVRRVDNVYLDLSGSGVDRGMLDACIDAVGVRRLLWGCDLTICTGWAKLRYLEGVLTAIELDAVRFGNARNIFPRHRFPG
jgi:predicted TIM-barrel fold metal-dependent hydrolase